MQIQRPPEQQESGQPGWKHRRQKRIHFAVGISMFLIFCFTALSPSSIFPAVFLHCRLGGTSVEQYWKTKLDSLQADMTFLEKKQAQLDREQQMVDKEDELSKRLVSIENYEREVSLEPQRHISIENYEWMVSLVPQ